MAPYLYLFFSDVLTYMFNDAKYDINGLTLPDGSSVRIQSFVDDMALFLQGDPTNLQKAFDILELFCDASGAKLNWHKSCALWIFERPKPWQWGEDKGLQ
jgi:hypothetical protein